jgi:hypothetical protein
MERDETEKNTWKKTEAVRPDRRSPGLLVCSSSHHEKLTKRKEITIEVQVPLVCQLPVDAGEPFPVACNTAPTHGNTIAIFKASAPTSGPLVLWSTLLALGGEDREVEISEIRILINKIQKRGRSETHRGASWIQSA